MFVKAVEHGEIALAGDAEDGVDTLREQGFDEGVAGQARGWACHAGHSEQKAGALWRRHGRAAQAQAVATAATGRALRRTLTAVRISRPSEAAIASHTPR